MKLRSNNEYGPGGHRVIRNTGRRYFARRVPFNPAKVMPVRPVKPPHNVGRWPSLRHATSHGLFNPGNYCYRRCLVQCLLHLPAMYNHLGVVHKTCHLSVEHCVVCALQGLMQKHWNDRSAGDFPLDREGGSITTLDDAINFCAKGTDFAKFATPTVQGDPAETLAFLYGRLLDVEHHNSKRLDRLLTIRHKISWTCADCGVARDRQEPGTVIVLNVEDRRKNQTLMDYLRQFHSDEVEIRCDEGCEGTGRGLVRRSRTFTITSSPEILCIQLGRFQLGGFQPPMDSYEVGHKVTAFVAYPEILELDKFTPDQRKLRYRLYGVVAHSGGQSCNSGHYIAAVRRQDGQGCNTINDSGVNGDATGAVDQLLRPQSRGRRFDATLLFYLRM